MLLSQTQESDESDANLDNDIPNRRTPHDTQKAQKVLTSIGIGTNSEELGEPDADIPPPPPNNPHSSCYLES